MERFGISPASDQHQSDTPFAGAFETHVTVDLGDESCADKLREWAARRGLKFTHIVLERGQTPSQPMLTRHGHGVLASELSAAAGLVADLQRDGFVVSRVKIEVPTANPDVPQSDGDAANQPGDRYFEHHVKLLFVGSAKLAALTNVARQHAAHVSRNALRVRSDGRQERFITQRCYAVGLPSARLRLDALLAALASAGGHELLEVEQEFVVYDSNLAMDRGWIEP